ncbi:MAG: helix-turn-helix domain-containing protein [Bacteroidota bacterium]
MGLDIWSILIIVIAFQGLFLGSVLVFSAEKRRKSGNGYLLLIIVTLIWFLAEFFAVRNKIDVGLNIFYGTRYGSWFLFGPFTYFYFKSITDTRWKFSKRHLWHFLPFVIFVMIIPFIAYKALNNAQVDYGMLSVFDHRQRVLTTIQWVYSVIFIIQFVHLGAFLFKNLRLVRVYSGQLQLEYSNIDSKIKWLRNFNVTLIAVLICSAAFLYLLLVTDIYRRHLDYIYVVPIGLLFYYISFKFMRTEWKPVENGSKYAGSSLDANQIPELRARLDGLMDREKAYLNHVIRLRDLADMMEIKTHHLSQILNQEYKLSFYDFINLHRISEAKKIIIDHPDYTFIKVAFEAGFNNKTSFVNAFKKFEKTTPSKFREAQLNS